MWTIVFIRWLASLFRRKRDRYEIDDTRAYLASISAGASPKEAKPRPVSLLGKRIVETRVAAIFRLAMNGFISDRGGPTMMSGRLPRDIKDNEAGRWLGYRGEDERR